MKLYHDFLDHLSFAGNPADSVEDLEAPIQFDDLFFEKEVFEELVYDFQIDLNLGDQFELKEILKNHLNIT